jgi:tyrosine-protein kinase Etk/Wzc
MTTGPEPEAGTPSSRHRAEEAGLGEYLAIVMRHRYLIAGVCVIALAIAFVVTLRTPRWYDSSATILVPKEAGPTGLLGGLAASAFVQQASGLSIPSLAPNRDMFVSVLKSRRIGQAVVDKFGLTERYRARYPEDAIRRLQDLTQIVVTKEGVIVVRIEDTDPRGAAAMANFYVDQLDRLVARFNTGEAGRQRSFVTEQLARAKGDLGAAEEALRAFQEKNRAVVLQDQTRGAIDVAARLKGEIMAAEVQLQVLRNFATDANPEIVVILRRIDQMKRQLAQVEYGENPGRSPGSADRRDFSVPFSRVPEVGLELARYTRDVKVQETLVSLLIQQLEQVKIAEAKDIPVVQVLDPAVPASRHVRPSFMVNLGVAVVASLLAGTLLAFVVEAVRRPRRSQAPPR